MEYAVVRMTQPARERRRYARLSPPNVRVRCVSGQYDDLVSGVNFARSLLNVSLGGMCVETTGRLRAGVKMSAELRFDDFGGALRTQAELIWVNTVKNGAAETYVAGFRFIGPEFTTPVREFLQGGRASIIVDRRQAEYQELKQKAETRRAAAGPKKWSAPKKTAASFLLLIFCYVAVFGGLVTAGRRESAAGVHFRYLGAESKGGDAEERLARLYAPLLWALQKAGVELTYDQP